MAQLEEIVISPPAGVVKVDSRREIEGRWEDTINARFVKRLPQKIGGWIKGYTTATNGVPRSLHAWRDRSFNAFLAVGTYISSMSMIRTAIRMTLRRSAPPARSAPTRLRRLVVPTW